MRSVRLRVLDDGEVPGQVEVVPRNACRRERGEEILHVRPTGFRRRARGGDVVAEREELGARCDQRPAPSFMLRSATM